jgi:hypothetical protein
MTGTIPLVFLGGLSCRFVHILERFTVLITYRRNFKCACLWQTNAAAGVRKICPDSVSVCLELP